MSVTRVKKRKRLDYVSLYLDVDWERTFKPKWSDSAVELSFYKGKVTINIPYGTARAKALQEQTGFVVAGTAWMHDKDIDAFIKVLRQGQRVYRMHQQDIRKVAKCEACRKIFGGVCATHRKLFKKYGKKKSPSEARPVDSEEGPRDSERGARGEEAPPSSHEALTGRRR